MVKAIRIASSLFVLIVILSVIPTNTSGSFQYLSETRDGVSIEVEPETERRVVEEAREISDELSMDIPENAFLLFDGEGSSWFVLTDRTPQDARATVEGTEIPASSIGLTRGLIIAESVEFETSGQEVTMEELRLNPGSYMFEIVEVEADLRNIAVVDDAGEGTLSIRRSQGVIALQFADKVTGPNPDYIVSRPGQTARWAAINMSANDAGSNAEISDRIGGASVGLGVVDWEDSSYWIDARTRVTGIVLPFGDTPGLVLVDTDVTPEKEVSLEQLANGDGVNQGDVVSLEANVIGSRISSKKSLLNVARCAPDSVTNPITGCLPLTVDTTLHSGIAFDSVPDDRADAIVYAGLSNHIQSQAVVGETGRYRLTGRVVKTDKIDPRLADGYGLIIYEKNRLGDVDIETGARTRIRSWSDDLVTKMVSQMNTSQREWAESGPPTPTASPTPIESPTSDGTSAGPTANESVPETESTTPGQPGLGFTVAVLALVISAAMIRRQRTRGGRR